MRLGPDGDRTSVPSRRGALDIRFSALALLVAVACIVAMGWLFYRSAVHAQQDVELARHTQLALRTVAGVKDQLARAESAQLAYLLTEDSSFAAERDAAIAEFRANLSAVQALTDDDVLQQLRVRELRGQATHRVQVLMNTVTRTPDEVEATFAARTRVTDLTAEIMAEEVAILDENKREYARQLRLEVIILSLLIIASLLGVLVSYHHALGQKALRLESQRQMSDILANLPVTAWQVRVRPDGNRKFVYVSPSAEINRGISADLLRGDAKLALGIVHEEDRARVEAATVDAERSLERFDEKYRIRRADGEVRWVEGCADLRREPDGSTLWNGFWRDVTTEVKLAQQLRAAYAELETFTYSVSHDLRTPMAAIAAFSRAIGKRAGAGLDAQSRQDLDRITEAIVETNGLIDALLRLARLSRQPLQREPVDLSLLADAIVADLREQDPSNHCEVQAEPGLTAFADRALVRQVLANLLENAWKFTRLVNQARIRVGRGTSASGEAFFFVQDNGAGFDASKADRLFEPFQRMHRSDRFPGTGVGLATVKRIVTRHGGRIWFESAPAVGATFYFTLPE